MPSAGTGRPRHSEGPPVQRAGFRSITQVAPMARPRKRGDAAHQDGSGAPRVGDCGSPPKELPAEYMVLAPNNIAFNALQPTAGTGIFPRPSRRTGQRWRGDTAQQWSHTTWAVFPREDRLFVTMPLAPCDKRIFCFPVETEHSPTTFSGGEPQLPTRSGPAIMRPAESRTMKEGSPSDAVRLSVAVPKRLGRMALPCVTV